MKFGAFFGWGIVLYAIAYTQWSAFVVYGFTAGIAPRALQLVTVLFVAFIAGRSLKFRNWKDVLPYSLGWALMVAGLDALFAAPLLNWSEFTYPNLWFGYALVVIVPLFAPLTHSASHPAGKWRS